MSYPNYNHHRVFADITAERARQDAKWGVQRHPDGTSNDPDDTQMAEMWKDIVDRDAAQGTTNWVNILSEEMFEAFAETDPVKLRAELIQCAAVITNWVEDIDSRTVSARPQTVGEAIIALVPGAEGAGVKP